MCVCVWVSSRRPTLPFEGISADAKGPFATPTPEGHLYFFLLVCLFSSFYWVVLAKSQAEWSEVWPAFVAKAEARTGGVLHHYGRPENQHVERDDGL